MRIIAVILFSMVLSGAGVALAQSEPAGGERAATAPQEAPDEVIVRGRRLQELRVEVEDARERAYDLFNEINSDDDFDIRCRDERMYHSHALHRACRPKFEDRIQAAAAREYLSGLFLNCAGGGGVTQDCMFSNVGQSAIHAAGGVEGQLPAKQDQMADEVLRLANQDDRFARAIIDWYEARRQYDEARKRRKD